MPVYEYSATDQQSSSKSGLLTSESPRQARDELRSLGLKIIFLKEQPSTSYHSSSSIFKKLFQRSSDTQLTNFVNEMSTLLSVDIPIIEALDTQIAQAKGPFQTSLMHLRDEIVSGKNLADAMKKQGSTFDLLTISMVEVGENSGNLEAVLSKLSDFRQRSSQFKDRVFSAMMYPTIVFAIAIFVGLFLMTYVIPTLLTDLVKAGQELPWPTLVLKTISDSLIQFGWIYAIAAAVAIAAFLSFLQSNTGIRLWYQTLLKLPVLGQMSMKQELSRIGLVISMLMKSGLPFLSATGVAIKTTKNILLKENLENCRRSVEQGRDIGEALSDNSFFPPLFVHVFSIGQKSGRLEEMLEKLSDDYNRQVEVVSSRLSSILEPVLILGLSIFIGFLLFATMLPILEAGNVQ